ncbi:MAG: hypothetical protein JNL75_12390 [Chitinophagales bacterium]|nr:hypothetical protein [Chitinophagales bacterium]
MFRSLTFGFLLIWNYHAFTQNVKNIELAPKGVYAEVDVEVSNGLVNFLTRGEADVKQKAAEEVLKNPNNYNPTVLFALSQVLFNSDKKDQACFWFYVAQLRARYDANRCMDITATSGLAVLNEQYGTTINQYAFKDINKLKETVKSVVSFVRSNEENYDPRWMNLHGMDAINASLDKEDNKKTKQKELSQPKAEWKAIKEKTINDYFADFQEFLKSLKK